jgi:hypothetical protein
MDPFPFSSERVRKKLFSWVLQKEAIPITAMSAIP